MKALIKRKRIFSYLGSELGCEYRKKIDKKYFVPIKSEFFSKDWTKIIFKKWYHTKPMLFNAFCLVRLRDTVDNFCGVVKERRI